MESSMGGSVGSKSRFGGLKKRLGELSGRSLNGSMRSMLSGSGRSITRGIYLVPDGVAVQELHGGKKNRLGEECPESVKDLLESKDSVPVYNKLIAALKKETENRNYFGFWKDAEFVAIIDLFRDEFAEKKIRVALCGRSSVANKYRWLEFVDIEIASDYIPEFDAVSTSGQEIKTVYTTLDFPYGVAVEELKSWKGRKKLKEKIPSYVEMMMIEKHLLTEYEQLVTACIKYGIGARMFKNWDIEKLRDVIEEFRPKFAAKGVGLFISYKEEYVSHGRHGGCNHCFRWIEFVDRDLQPNYMPTYLPKESESVDGEDCIIS